MWSNRLTQATLLFALALCQAAETLGAGSVAERGLQEAFVEAQATVQGLKRLEPQAAPGSIYAQGFLDGIWDSITGRSPQREITPNVMRFDRDILLKDSQGNPVVLKADFGRTPEGADRFPVIPGVVFSSDQKLCGDISGGDVEKVLNQTRLILDINKMAARLGQAPHPRSLQPDEIGTLNTTPACKPFLIFLLHIEGLLKPGESAPVEPRLKALILANSKELRTGVLGLKVGKAAAFLRLNQDVKFDGEGDPYGISDVAVPAGLTGQDVGLELKLTKRGEASESDYTTTQSCTGTRRVRVCRNGQCDDIEITWYGRRSVTHRGTYRLDDYIVKLLGQDQRVLGEIGFSIGDGDDSRPVYGPCIEESIDEPRGF